MSYMHTRAFSQADTLRCNPALAGFSVTGYAVFPSDIPVNASAQRTPAPAAEQSVALW
jgi:hypothetical protein